MPRAMLATLWGPAVHMDVEQQSVGKVVGKQVSDGSPAKTILQCLFFPPLFFKMSECCLVLSSAAAAKLAVASCFLFAFWQQLLTSCTWRDAYAPNDGKDLSIIRSAGGWQDGRARVQRIGVAVLLFEVGLFSFFPFVLL